MSNSRNRTSPRLLKPPGASESLTLCFLSRNDHCLQFCVYFLAFCYSFTTGPSNTLLSLAHFALIYIVSSIFYSLLFHLIWILRLVHVCVAIVRVFSQLNFILLRRQSLFIPFLVSGPSGLFPVFCHRRQCCCEHTSTCPVFSLVRVSLNDRLLFFVLTCLSLVTGEVGHLSCVH